jgi:hypothetical protein
MSRVRMNGGPTHGCRLTTGRAVTAALRCRSYGQLVQSTTAGVHSSFEDGQEAYFKDAIR